MEIDKGKKMKIEGVIQGEGEFVKKGEGRIEMEGDENN